MTVGDEKDHIPSRASIRKIMQEELTTDSDLDAFCLDYFPLVHRQFSSGHTRTQKDNILIETVDPVEIAVAIQRFKNGKLNSYRYRRYIGYPMIALVASLLIIAMSMLVINSSRSRPTVSVAMRGAVEQAHMPLHGPASEGLQKYGGVGQSNASELENPFLTIGRISRGNSIAQIDWSNDRNSRIRGELLPFPNEETSIDYESKTTNNKLHIIGGLKYLARIAGSDVMRPVFFESIRKFNIPVIDIGLTNNSSSPIHIAALKCDVRSFDGAMMVIPLIEFRSTNHIRVRNIGWEKMIDPQIHIKQWHAFDVPVSVHSAVTVRIGQDLRRIIPNEIHIQDETKERIIGVYAILTYAISSGRQYSIPFRTMIEISPNNKYGSGLGSSASYDLRLPANKNSYTRTIPISQILKPSESDRFTVRVLAERSGRFEMSVSLMDVDGVVVKKTNLILDAITPNLLD